MASAIGQEEVAYRVAGIIDAGTRVIALIESTDGTQKLYQVGERIDDWEVMDIDTDGATLGYQGQRIRLPLLGEAIALASGMPDAMEFRTVSKTASFATILDQLGELEFRADRKNMAPTFEDINRVLGLPPETRIQKIDEVPASSPQAIIASATKPLLAGVPFRLTLSDHDANEMYIVPAAMQASEATRSQQLQNRGEQ